MDFTVLWTIQKNIQEIVFYILNYIHCSQKLRNQKNFRNFLDVFQQTCNIRRTIEKNILKLVLGAKNKTFL